ncbi:MAG: hypothetical protein ACRDU4_00175, partial [Mycobacterium sp.]
ASPPPEPDRAAMVRVVNSTPPRLCAVNSTSPTSHRTAQVGGVKFTALEYATHIAELVHRAEAITAST